MQCSDAREWISADLDHEAPPEIRDPLDRHLGTCRACRAFGAESSELQRSFRLQPAAAVPDRTSEILAAIGRRPTVNPDPVRTLRWIIAVLAVLQLAAAVPLFFIADHAGAGHDGEAVHLGRHIGTSAIALAIGLLVVAWRPARAATLLPVLAVLVAGLAWSCLADILAGRPVPGSVFAHGLDLAALLAVTMLYRWHRSGDLPGRGVLVR